MINDNIQNDTLLSDIMLFLEFHRYKQFEKVPRNKLDFVSTRFYSECPAKYHRTA